jgi:hypothetical protein
LPERRDDDIRFVHVASASSGCLRVRPTPRRDALVIGLEVLKEVHVDALHVGVRIDRLRGFAEAAVE